MQFIRDMIKCTLTIEPCNHPVWWVESSYAFDPDMKCHTGIYMTLGKGEATQLHVYKS